MARIFDTPDGTGIRDYIHVNDLADAHVRALHYLEKENKSEVINLGASLGLSVMQVLQVSKDLSGVDFPVKIRPRRSGDPPIVVADSQKAHQLLDWQAQNSDIHSIVNTMLLAYQSQ